VQRWSIVVTRSSSPFKVEDPDVLGKADTTVNLPQLLRWLLIDPLRRGFECKRLVTTLRMTLEGSSGKDCS